VSTIPSYGSVLDEHDEIITVVGVAVLGLCPRRAGAIQNCRVWMPQSPPYRLACDRLAVSAAVPSLMRSVTDPYQDVAAIVGGAAMIISLVLDWLVVPYEKLGVAGAYLTASYPVSSGLRLLGTVLFLWALLALYNRQSIAVGTFGLWSFVVAFFGTALLAGEV
jgi:hypothetical protein